MSTASRTAWVAVSEPSVPTTIELNMTPLFAGGSPSRWRPVGRHHIPRRAALPASRLTARAPTLSAHELRTRPDLLLRLVGAHGGAQAAPLGARPPADRRSGARDRPRVRRHHEGARGADGRPHGARA